MLRSSSFLMTLFMGIFGPIESLGSFSAFARGRGAKGLAQGSNARKYPKAAADTSEHRKPALSWFQVNCSGFKLRCPNLKNGCRSRLGAQSARVTPGIISIGWLTRFADVQRPDRISYVDLVDVDQAGLFHHSAYLGSRFV